MDKIGAQSKENGVSYANKLPAEIVGRFQQNLSVGECLKSERVSPLWKRALEKWGWTEQKKLDADIVFEGVTEEEFARFWEELDDGTCQLALLVHCSGPWLRELDLHSFGQENIQRFLPQIVKSIESTKMLEKLNIRGLLLQDFVDHLLVTLREIETSGGLIIETLQALSQRCPNLEEVPFTNLVNNLVTEPMLELAGMFLRQKYLYLSHFTLRSENQGALASIGQLKMLEELYLWNCDSLDGESLGAIVGGCQRLRYLSFNTRHLAEKELFQLANIQNLTVLDISDYEAEFTDAVLKAIAKQGKLKKLRLFGFDSKEKALTDDSILYLVDRCKSLVFLHFYDNYPKITDRSLEAVFAEVRRRHGCPPQTLPTGDFDSRIFYFFSSFNTGIDHAKAHDQIAGNPWMRFERSDPRQII